MSRMSAGTLSDVRCLIENLCAMEHVIVTEPRPLASELRSRTAGSRRARKDCKRQPRSRRPRRVRARRTRRAEAALPGASAHARSRLKSSPIPFDRNTKSKANTFIGKTRAGGVSYAKTYQSKWRCPRSTAQGTATPPRTSRSTTSGTRLARPAGRSSTSPSSAVPPPCPGVRHDPPPSLRAKRGDAVGPPELPLPLGDAKVDPARVAHRRSAFRTRATSRIGVPLDRHPGHPDQTDNSVTQWSQARWGTGPLLPRLRHGT